MLSLAEVVLILDGAPATNCIVSTMDYNHISPEAKTHCRELGVGVFRAVDLFGAIYYDGERFLDYVRPERR